jgi:hypothetical protein
MDTRKASELPARLEGVRQRFEHWRRTCKAHSRIPDSLWASAVLMAGAYGVSRTANVLRVNYHALKKRLGEKTAAVRSYAAADETRFVELTPFTPAASCECLVELEDGAGAKMRVRLQGVGMADLAALVRSFRDRQR